MIFFMSPGVGVIIFILAVFSVTIKVFMPKSKGNIFHPFKPPSDINRAIKDLSSHEAGHWERKGEKMVLDLVRWVGFTTPAYQVFLKKHSVNPKNIRTIEDFQVLPIPAPSGSAGEPFYFPRNGVHDDMYQYEAEIFLREQFRIDKKSTLAVLGFGLGIWIGGIFTYKVLERISEKKYPLTIVPAGTSKEQFLQAIQKFGKLYDQIILMGYPPFIKDVLDEGKGYGVDWKDYEIKILTAAEGYSEKFREDLARKAGVKNMLNDIVNIYGTVEFGTMAHETALSNLIRHLATQNKRLFKRLFPEAGNIPTLCQYYPQFVYFEEVEVAGKREIIRTGDGCAILLIRSRFTDLG